MKRVTLFRKLLVLGLTGSILVGTGCGDDDDTTKVPSTASQAEPTGIAQVDAVVAAVEARDTSAIRKLLGFSRLACTTEPGEGGPPKCLSGEAGGTSVDVFLVYGCAVDWRRESSVDSALSDLAAISPKRYAVFVPPADYLLKKNDYVVVFEGPDPRSGGSSKRGAAAAVNSGKITALWLACGAGDGGETLVPKGLASFVVPPR